MKPVQHDAQSDNKKDQIQGVTLTCYIKDAILQHEGAYFVLTNICSPTRSEN